MAGHFIDFGILPEICGSLEEMGWHLPTDIQAEAIPLILGGTDVFMAAETGSGKTGAFAIPIIQLVHEKLSRKNIKKIDTKKQLIMSSKQRDSEMAIDPSGLLCQSRSARWQGCKCESGVASGKAYYEVTVNDEGLCRVGWSAADGLFDIGLDCFSFGYGGTGKKAHRKQFDDYGVPFGKGDIIGCYIDLEQLIISFSHNGRFLGQAFKIQNSLKGKWFYPAVCLKNAECSVCFTGSIQKHFPTTGYRALDEFPDTSLGSIYDDAVDISTRPPESPLAIVLEPSRELALQVRDNLRIFLERIQDPKPRVTVLIGGEDVKTQLRELRDGVDILVGTPHKIFDFLSNNSISSAYVHYLVLDEADALLKMDSKLITNLFLCCNTKGSHRVQAVICSATLRDGNVAVFAERFYPFAMWVDLKGMDSVPDTVHHVVCRVDPSVDDSWVELEKSYSTDDVHVNDKLMRGSKEYYSEGVKYLKIKYLERAIIKHKMDQVIVFCRMKLDCDNLEKYLTRVGGGPNAAYSNQFSCKCLHGDRDQAERTDNVRAFKQKKVRILICTLVGARGLDISGVPYLICVTLPDEVSDYVHMIGRVGRAERMGLVISLVAVNSEKVWYHKCRKPSCRDTRTLENKGCCMWLNELQNLGAIEGHLVETIETINSSFEIPVNQLDGKVVYGRKKTKIADNSVYNTEKIHSVLQKLSSIEQRAQDLFLNKFLLRR